MKEYERLARELIVELCKMDLEELQEFKIKEESELKALGFPQEIRNYLTKIIDLVIQAEREREGEAI